MANELGRQERLNCWRSSLSSFGVYGGLCDTTRQVRAIWRGMSGARVTLVLTCVVVAGLAGWFAMAKWDQANKVATMMSALGAVAAVGIAIWIALRSSPSQSGRAGRIRVANTGGATAMGAGSTAITGVRTNGGDTSSLRVGDTGDAQADSGGNAVSGVHLD